MRKIEVIVKFKGGSDTWKETLNCPDDVSAESHAKVIIFNFNKSIRKGEKLRELVKVLGVSDLPPDHDWRKTNLVTISGRNGMYDTYKCEVCGITGKRFGLGRISRDAKFQAEKYRFCKTKIKLVKRTRRL